MSATQDRGQQARDLFRQAQDHFQQAQDYSQQAQDHFQQAQDLFRQAQEHGQQAQDSAEQADAADPMDDTPEVPAGEIINLISEDEDEDNDTHTPMGPVEVCGYHLPWVDDFIDPDLDTVDNLREWVRECELEIDDASWEADDPIYVMLHFIKVLLRGVDKKMKNVGRLEQKFERTECLLQRERQRTRQAQSDVAAVFRLATEQRTRDGYGNVLSNRVFFVRKFNPAVLARSQRNEFFPRVVSRAQRRNA